jgi:succinate-acetate transporter protein
LAMYFTIYTAFFFVSNIMWNEKLTWVYAVLSVLFTLLTYKFIKKL